MQPIQVAFVDQANQLSGHKDYMIVVSVQVQWIFSWTTRQLNGALPRLIEAVANPQ